MRGRCVVLAAVTAGVSWLATGHAMADGTTMTDACKPHNQNSPANLNTLTPPSGVLSIADTAGAAAAHGLPSMPGRPATTTTGGTAQGGIPKGDTPKGGAPKGGAAKGGAAQGAQGAPGKSAAGRPRTLPAPAPDASTVLPALPNAKKAAPAGAQMAPQAVSKAVPAEMPNPAPAVDAAQSVAKQAATGASSAAEAAQPSTTVPMVPLMAIAPARPGVMRQACTPAAAKAGNEHNPKGRNSAAAGRGKNDKSSSRSGAEFLPAHPHGRPHHKVPSAVVQPGDKQHGGQNAVTPAGPGRPAHPNSGTQEAAGTKAKQADQGRGAQGHRSHNADAKTRSAEGANTRTGVVHPKAPAHPNGAVPNDLTAPALAKAADTHSVTRLANNATDSTILP
ncbi:hypothetical protein Psi02_19680 [Planotetraspora silvatica]|uniref:Uncharacterized protein n=2 Tax=Planotetraspora silvatica TaxID=234614 RepID=A0A8J3XLF5_9ACTN|nr:hypothetical protein Psi02_19680 [Planotetraspora silvatica]